MSECNADLGHPCDADNGEPCKSCKEYEDDLAHWYQTKGRFQKSKLEYVEDMVAAGRQHLLTLDEHDLYVEEIL